MLNLAWRQGYGNYSHQNTKPPLFNRSVAGTADANSPKRLVAQLKSLVRLIPLQNYVTGFSP